MTVFSRNFETTTTRHVHISETFVLIFVFADSEPTTLVKLLGPPMAVTEYEIKNLFSRYGNVVSCVRGTASFCRGGGKEGEDKLEIVAFTHNQS